MLAPVQFDGCARGDFDDGARGADGACADLGVPDSGGVPGTDGWRNERGAGMRGGREERRGGNCRRADNSELEQGALGARRILLALPCHFEGGVCPRDPSFDRDPREIHRAKKARWKTEPHPGEAHGAHKSRFARLRRVRNDGGLVSALVATATCKAFAKCRRADISKKWKFVIEVVG